MDQFNLWLDQELAKRGWNDYQLSKKAGISHSVISKARSGILPKWQACFSLANALSVAPETVFRLAGLLSKAPDWSPEKDEWDHLFAQLPSEEREELLQIARIKYERKKSSP
ncbi:MAG TPA: hypothetical protein PK530_22245 [Anaerolineales bacterium]|nr:hypothetical protein [Anaerolineales bacterium]